MVRRSKPLRVEDRAVRSKAAPKQSTEKEATGRQVKVEGTAGASATASPQPRIAQNGTWPGANTANPNRQVGKLYFDTQRGPGVSWSHCTATVVTAANKSTVITAGHCVYSPDPDGNSIVSGNGYWYENFQFCPGYQYGCKMGVWKYRTVVTTNTWFRGLNGRYNYSDDVALVLLSPSNGRYVQNVTGSQGIIFNQATGLVRHAFGYPAKDYRWPEYNYDGEDLIYAKSVDTYDSSKPGTMWINSTMTGGSSGGPWLIRPNANWLGYVNSVNSHKPHGGKWMNGPYFGNAELQLYQAWRAA
jgi:hypothetical protein